MKSFAIYFKDLKISTQTQFCETFGTTPRGERDNAAPLIVIEREGDTTTYLGGGVHATYQSDGEVFLMGNDTGAVYLNPTAYENLQHLINRCRPFAEKENERKEPENLANTNDTEEG